MTTENPEEPFHRSADELAAGLEHVRAAPTDQGSLELIVARPDVDQRDVRSEAELCTKTGLVGDNWDQRSSTRTDDGSPHPDMQLNVMNARATELVAGPRDRWALCGDQLYVDLDLSYENLPPGTRLRIGAAVIEITDQPHRGCAKFRRRFGAAALSLVNSEDGVALNLRGINAKVVEPGAIAQGDTVAKLDPTP